MKAKLLLSSLVSFAVALLGAGSAQAFMVAGWDFSQYIGDSLLIIDDVNFTPTDVLASNYSDYVPDDPGSAAIPFGTMYLNGQFGSTDTPLDFTNDPFIPSSTATPSGNLTSNASAPAGDPFSSLVLAGQSVVTPLTMAAISAATVVFGADLPGTDLGETWTITFGGKTNSGESIVGIEFSTNGTTFTSFGTRTLTDVDTAFSVALGTAQSNQAWVRLTFSPGASQSAYIDNFAFNATLVPEPATAALLLAGLAGLARVGRRRA